MTPSSFSPFNEVAIPFSKPKVIYSASLGAFSKVLHNSRILSYLGSFSGNSKSKPSWLKCHRFLSLL